MSKGRFTASVSRPATLAVRLGIAGVVALGCDSGSTGSAPEQAPDDGRSGDASSETGAAETEAAETVGDASSDETGTVDPDLSSAQDAGAQLPDDPALSDPSAPSDPSDPPAAPDPSAPPDPSDPAVDAGMTDTPPSANACGQPENGERLRMSGLMGDDGSWEFTRWYDTELEQTCLFQPTVDGEYHCIPWSAATLTYSTVYADADCTEMMAFDVRSACDQAVAPTHALVEAGKECVAWRVYELGARLDGPSVVYDFDDEGKCVSAVWDSEFAELYEITSEVPEESMVVGTYESVGARIQHGLLLASDGASQRLPLPYDTEHNTRCHPGLAADGTQRCLSIDVATVSYADATCMDPVAVALPPPALSSCPSTWPYDEPPAQFVSQQRTNPDDPPECGRRRSVFEYTAAEPASTLTTTYSQHPDEPTTCTERLDSGGEYVAVSELPPESFLSLSLEQGGCGPNGSSGARLQRWNVVAEDGYVFEGRFFDANLGDFCAPTAATDGKLRCLPGAGVSAGNGLYADANCTVAAAFVSLPCPIGLEADQLVTRRFAELPVELDADTPNCERRAYEIYELGAEVETLYRLDYDVDPDGTCTPVETSTSAQGAYREVLQVLDPSAFVEFTEFD